MIENLNVFDFKLDDSDLARIAELETAANSFFSHRDIARRVSAGKHVLLADLKKENAEAAAKILRDAGFETTTATVDVSARASVHTLVETAVALGNVTGVIHAAGVSPS